MDVPTRRIVLLGKSGSGKSSLANTILGEDLFEISHFPTSESSHSQSQTKRVDGKSFTLIELCSFFGTCGSEAELQPEILRCITECAPGPHAFLIVLKVEKFTEQEKEVVRKICHHFSEDALRYAAVIFTHGDQLPEGMKVEEFITKNKALGELVNKCGGRCHVVDNKYWKENKGDNYRNNQLQVAQILNTIEEMIKGNKGSCYTNEMLQAVKREIQRKEEDIRRSASNVTPEEIGNRARISVFDQLLIKFTGTATGALLGALLGVAEMVTSLVKDLDFSNVPAAVAKASQSGLLRGGQLGLAASEGARSPREAARRAAEAVGTSTASKLGIKAPWNNEQRIEHRQEDATGPACSVDRDDSFK